jgi:phospholipase/carboxylesterase
MEETLDCVEAGPKAAARGAVVWLHGLGASGHDFEDVVPLLDLPGVRFVFPHAPERPVTINGGAVMRAWYDILELGGSLRGKEDEAGIRDSAEQVRALLRRENARGVPAGRIVLAGFSQGGAMALHVAHRYPEALRGIMVLSAYEVLPGSRQSEAAPANARTSLLACHGSLDPMVPFWAGRQTYEAYAGPDRPARWHAFPIGHAVCPEEIDVIRDWLKERFAGTA